MHYINSKKDHKVDWNHNTEAKLGNLKNLLPYCQLGFRSKIGMPQLGSARKLHSLDRLEPENSSSDSSLNCLPYGIDQSATVVADWSIWQFWRIIFTSFLVNLLLVPIGMLIPWLKKILDHKSETPNSRLAIQNSAFSVVLNCSISR